jgi:hypothetical protein
MHGAEIADLEGHSLTGERVERRLAAVLAADVGMFVYCSIARGRSD